MRLHKTWVQYMMEIVSTLTVSMLFLTVVLRWADAYGIVDAYTRIGLSCAAFFVVIGLSVGGRKLMACLGKKWQPCAGSLRGLEVFLVICILGGAFWLRFAAWQQEEYRQMAYEAFLRSDVLLPGMRVPILPDNLSYLCSCLLTFVAGKIGYSWEVCSLFQAALQLAGMLLLYFGVTYLLGRMAALACLAVSAFEPAFVESIFLADTGNYFFFLVALGIYACGLYMRKVRRKKFRGMTCSDAAFWTGVILGFVLMQDIAGICLFTIPVLGTANLRKKDGYSFSDRAWQIAMLFVGTVFTWFLSLFIKSYQARNLFWDSLQNWQSGFWGYEGVWPDGLLTGELSFLILVTGAFLYVACQWQFVKDRYFLCVPALLGFGYLHIAVYGQPLPYGWFFYLFLAMAAGSGLELLCSPLTEKRKDSGKKSGPLSNREKEPLSNRKTGPAEKEEAPMPPKTEMKAKIAAEMPEKTAETVKDVPAGRENMPVATAERVIEPTKNELLKNERTSVSDVREPASKTAVDEQEENLEKNRKDEAPKDVKFIPNPLPLPKKHVRRDMDYAFEPEEEQMKFDLDDLDELDDFDI